MRASTRKGRKNDDNHDDDRQMQEAAEETCLREAWVCDVFMDKWKNRENLLEFWYLTR